MVAGNGRAGSAVVSANAEVTKLRQKRNKTNTFDKRKTDSCCGLGKFCLETAEALMFPTANGKYVVSLMPASQFAQKKVGVVARLADVVQDDRAANLARVVDDDVTKAHQPLRNACRDGHILDFAQWNIFRRASDQASVDLEFRVCDSVADHVPLDVVVSRNQQQREAKCDRDRRRHSQRREEKHERNAT